jgi:hypothetical protein
MRALRFRDDNRRGFEFQGRMLLRCPKCGARAVSEPLAVSVTTPVPNRPRPQRLACSARGLAWHWPPERATPPAVGRDPYFRLPYWLAVRCRHGVVWAMNEEQLTCLESFIAAGPRERRRGAQGWANSSYVSRLPGWMKLAKNRAEPPRCVDRLRVKLTTP